jgi:hypothetical protein
MTNSGNMNMAKCSSLFAAALLSASATPLIAAYSQDFESGTAGITPREGAIESVASGGGWIGAPSSQGSRHGEILLLNDQFETGFGFGVSWNDNAGAGSFYSGGGAGFSVYLDNPSRAGYYEAGDGWWFQPTLLYADGSAPIAAGGFGVRNTGTGWQIAATGNALGGFDYGLHFSSHPQNSQASLVMGNTFTATQGWYRFETIWVINGTGGINQVNSIFNQAGNMVFLATITNVVSDASLAGNVGTAWIGQDGARAGETTFSGNAVPTSYMADLAVDSLYVIPEPGTVAALLGLFAAGVVVFFRRRRNA